MSKRATPPDDELNAAAFEELKKQLEEAVPQLEAELREMDFDLSGMDLSDLDEIEIPELDLSGLKEIEIPELDLSGLEEIELPEIGEIEPIDMEGAHNGKKDRNSKDRARGKRKIRK